MRLIHTFRTLAAALVEVWTALKLPLRLIPGNHDNAGALYSAVAGRAGDPAAATGP